MLHITATPATSCNLIVENLREICPDLDYELAVADLRYEITRSQKPHQRVIVQSIGSILELDELHLIRDAITCCACVADTLFDIVTNATTHRVTPVHRGLVILPRTFWFQHDPVANVIIKSSVEKDFEKPCGYDRPLIWSPKVQTNINNIHVVWTNPEHFRDGKTVNEAHILPPDKDKIFFRGMLVETVSVIPEGLELINKGIDQLNSLLI